MTLTFKTCPICDGTGKLSILKSRINIFSKLLGQNIPLLKDDHQQCSHCKGTGRVYVKINPFFNPWNPFNRSDS